MDKGLGPHVTKLRSLLVFDLFKTIDNRKLNKVSKARLTRAVSSMALWTVTVGDAIDQWDSCRTRILETSSVGHITTNYLELFLYDELEAARKADRPTQPDLPLNIDEDACRLNAEEDALAETLKVIIQDLKADGPFTIGKAPTDTEALEDMQTKAIKPETIKFLDNESQTGLSIHQKPDTSCPHSHVILRPSTLLIEQTPRGTLLTIYTHGYSGGKIFKLPYPEYSKE